MLDLLDVLPRVLALIEVAEGQAGIAPDGGKQVVEVVRDPACELPDTFHLLRLPQLGFQGRSLRLCLLPIRNVPGDAQNGGRAGELNHLRDHLDGYEGAVASNVRRFEREIALLPEGGDSFRNPRRLFRRVDIAHGHAHELFLSVAEAVAGRLVGWPPSSIIVEIISTGMRVPSR